MGSVVLLVLWPVLRSLVVFLAGSSFWQSGTFEVFKRSAEQVGLSAIDVRVPPELEGSAYIQVSIHMTTRKSSSCCTLSNSSNIIHMTTRKYASCCTLGNTSYYTHNHA